MRELGSHADTTKQGNTFIIFTSPTLELEPFSYKFNHSLDNNFCKNYPRKNIVDCLPIGSQIIHQASEN